MIKQLILLYILIPLVLCAQEEQNRREILKEKGLFRNVLEHNFFTVREYGPVLIMSGFKENKYITTHGGYALRFYSNWFFTPEDRNRIFFRTNWITGGIAWADGILFPSAPLNIGFGNNYLINQSMNLEFVLSGGVVLIGPGYLFPYINPIPALYPEIKFQSKYICIGFSYTRHNVQLSNSNHVYNYFNLSLSKGFGSWK